MAAASSPFTVSHTTPPRSLCSNSKHKSHPLSPPTSSLFSSPHVAHRSFCQTLRYNNGVSPIGITPKRPVATVVKASMNTNVDVEVLSKEHLAVSLAKHVADLSNQIIRHKDCFTLVLSGDTVKYLKKLVEPPYINTVDWSKWHVFWLDEKVVPKSHVESNYKLTYDRFLYKVPIPARNINAMDDALPADGAADAYETTLRFLVKRSVIASSPNEYPKFDLILLDMGPDGHVGSLFPGHPVLNETKGWVTFMKDAPSPPRHRITMTLPVINACSNIAMVVTGAAKADAVYTAVTERSQRSEKLPVQLVSPEGKLKWFLDKGAASKLYY